MEIIVTSRVSRTAEQRLRLKAGIESYFQVAKKQYRPCYLDPRDEVAAHSFAKHLMSIAVEEFTYVIVRAR
jgi:hypothetical protein